MSLSIKIYVSCHNDTYVALHPMLIPVQVGAVLSDARFDMQHDDIGENISAKNRRYCELTAQYWAWKNQNADYYGFFHYRRYLSFNEKELVTYADAQKDVLQPYEIYRFPDQETLHTLGFDADQLERIIDQYDIIAPLPEEMYVSVYNHYKHSDFHDITDLELVLNIIEERYPAFAATAREYMKTTNQYFCNIFIMKRQLFHNYCAWLFDILEEYDRRADEVLQKGEACRVNGYLGERLFGIYYTWLKQQTNIRWAEAQRVHFEAFPGETDNFTKMRKINTLLKPGTRRRAWIKKLSSLGK